MTTRTKKTTLMGATEVADYLNVSRQRVLELRQKNPKFPEPLEQLKSGPVWDKAAIDSFLEGWDRTPGRPRKHPLAESHDESEEQQPATPSDPEEVAEPDQQPVEEPQAEPPAPEIPEQTPHEEPFGSQEVPAEFIPETLQPDN